MILDSLENRARYYALNPRLEKAFDYLLSTDLGALPAGRPAARGGSARRSADCGEKHNRNAPVPRRLRRQLSSAVLKSVS